MRLVWVNNKQVRRGPSVKVKKYCRKSHVEFDAARPESLRMRFRDRILRRWNKWRKHKVK